MRVNTRQVGSGVGLLFVGKMLFKENVFYASLF